MEIQLAHHEFILVAVVALAALWVTSNVRSALLNKLRHVPGPLSTNITNLPLKFATLRGYRWDYIHSLHQRYGPIVRISPQEVSVVTIPAIKDLYRIGSHFYKSTFYDNFGPARGDLAAKSLFTEQDPKQHSNRRRMRANAFADASVKQMEPFIAKNTRLSAQQMEKELSELGYTDVVKWFLFMATDVIGEASFGESFRMLHSGKKNQYTRDLEIIGFASLVRSEFPFLIELMRRLGVGRRLSQINKRLTTYASESITRYRKLYDNDPDNIQPSLLTKMFRLVDDGQVPSNVLLSDARSNIVAGSDTTSSTASSAVFLLSQYPEFEAKLIEEVAQLSDDFTDADARKLPLLGHVIQETLRLRGPVGQSLPRVVPPEGITLEGHFIPGGSTIGIPAYTIHRNADIFPDPERFDPSRWENPTQAMKDAFVAFGGGTRICIGMHFAQVELRYALAYFYRTFTKGMVLAEGEQGFNSKTEMLTFQAFLSSPRGGRCLMKVRQ